MANSIELAKKYQPYLDKVFQKEITSIDLEDSNVEFDGVDTVKVLEVEVPDNADYSRSSGFTEGDVNAVWRPYQLTQDRGREFSVDAVDNEETLDMTFGAVCGEFIRTKVAPETDLYRYATIASKSGVSVVGTPALLTTGDGVIAAINVAMSKMDEDEVPETGRILYITPTLKRLLDALETYKSQKVLEGFEKVVTVPQARFKSAITKDANKKYIRAATGVNLNFLIVHKSAVKAINKHTKLRVFLADVNQDMDAHKFQYRNVHDTFVYKNKGAGVYVHKVPLLTITISAGSHGSASAASITVSSGSVVKFSDNKVTIDGTTVTATASSGYHFGAWSGASDGAVLTSNTTISCTFAQDEA